MAKKLISYDDTLPGTGLPGAVEQRLDVRYSDAATGTDLGDAAGLVVLDPEAGDVQMVTITGNASLRIAPAPSGATFAVIATQTAGYSLDLSYVKWADGVTPTFTVTPGNADIYTFVSTGIGWVGILSAADISAPVPAIGDDFNAPDGTPLNGRLTPIGGATITAPYFAGGKSPTFVGAAANLITGGRVKGDAYTGSVPILSVPVRVSADFTLTEGNVYQEVRVILSDGNGDDPDAFVAYIGSPASGGLGVRAVTRKSGVTSGTVRFSQSPISGRLGVEWTGSSFQLLLNNIPVETPYTGMDMIPTHAGFALFTGAVTLDNFTVEYL